MRGPKPPQVIVSDRQRAILEQYTRATTKAASLVERARIILLTASGMPTLRVADELGVDRQRVRRWRSRWASELRTQLDAVEAVANDNAQWTRGLLARIAVEKGIVSSVSVAEIGRWLKKGG